MTKSALTSGRFTIGSNAEVTRLGFGAMRITGRGIWGPPANVDEARRVLRRVPELGIDHIDTADSYGPFISEDLIRQELHPYNGLTIATKVGHVRWGEDDPNPWPQTGRPEYLRAAAKMSLRRLGVDQLDILYLHRIDGKLPEEEQYGAMKELHDEGVARHIGLSNVTVDQIKTAREIVEVTAVQNLYNLTDRTSEDVLEYCEQEGIGFIPWFPLAAGGLSQPGGAVAEVAAAHDVTPGQVALAWLLKRSPVMLPIPGTGSVAHLEENTAAAGITLTDEEFATLDAAGRAESNKAPAAS